ncbi:glutaminyl-peptide cyclotransferase [Acidobacteriota bacterium]
MNRFYNRYECFLPILSVFILLFMFATCDSSDRGKQPSESSKKTITIKPLLIRSFPHDNQAYTQGLLYNSGNIYESTGLYGKSSLRSIRADNGAIIHNIPIKNVFAEGIVLLDDTLLQLTWRSERAFLYSFPDLEPIGIFIYQGEGWGITTDGTYYIMSDGSNSLSWRDNSFAVLKTTSVTLNSKPVARLNELEYAREKIYANVWLSPIIVEIDPENGHVTRIIDCSSLVQSGRLSGSRRSFERYRL